MTPHFPRTRPARWLLGVAALAGAAHAATSATQAHARSAEAGLCTEATAQAERSLHIPDGFLSAMGRVESGKVESDGTVSAWPWTINAAGIGYHYNSRAEAVAAVQNFRHQGIMSIDVGCMQVNLQQHPEAFPSLDQAFDPLRNAMYAGSFLLQMYEKMGSWPRAAAAYHSQTPGIGTPYQWKVLEAWAMPQDGREGPQTAQKSPLMPQVFPHPVTPAIHHTPMMVAEASTGMGPDGTPQISHPKAFHPFQGMRNFVEPGPVGNSRGSAMRGRSLASYRSAPVARASTQRIATQGNE
ncbi:transglycosylase SLT domain-containing protein [Acetobacter lambici]|uniref:Transglycosylase SLT domain-containing protein n=1 Tax=Acetobacter lambici TaxID=1332824 RepID=A0ABT1EXY3_9PROT|nr:transglycosylase SLT domain-containing protein [Acetobacter lambici]MCP1241684.1 transglycosylase SLT domain-containing protein [Acetobacter lambici]MCP1257809.1 transglycosylase SLT domain-containing protein [Acetobacter lambici]NHO56520.1 transglycosylase SLT domain-containing protein [Acetobacter lambici]